MGRVCCPAPTSTSRMSLGHGPRARQSGPLRRPTNAGVVPSARRPTAPSRASGISHNGSQRAGARRGGEVGSPNGARIWRTLGASVMKAVMRMSAPHRGQ